ncbi:internal virion protein B [Aeromonas phage PS]|uniref:Internal virion protein B n=1 Tax=Aeromonas phage PS TaxID=2723762 RepID=A0A6H0X6N0_9CAUD|nr:structural protein [Aeromonas phage PS]
MADIQIPSFVNVGGASFAPAYAKGNVDTSTGVSAIPELAKAAGSALTQIVQYENDNAFLQGQADYYAKTISEQSWLTTDSYQQGRSLSEFSTGILDYQQQASELARASVQAGEDLNTFTQKLAPVLKGMNDKVAALGLTGEAKDTALKTVLTSVASAQKLYQKELENETIRNRELGANQLGTAAVVAAMQPGADGAVIAGNLDAVFQGVYQLHANEDPKNALSKASKKSLGAVKEIVTRLQASSTDDLNKLKMLSGYMQRATNWTTDERDAALNAIDSKFMEFEKFQDTYDQEQIRTLETRLLSGEATIDDIRDAQSSLHVRVDAGTKDPSQANPLFSKLHALSLKADKAYGDNLLVSNGTYADWLRSGRSLGELGTKKTAQLVTAFNGDTSAAGVYLMRDSTRTNIPGEFKRGAELVTQGFQSFLNAPANSITEVQDTQADAVRTYATAWNQAADNPGQRDALIAALPKEWQGAMRQVLRSPDVDVTDMRQLKGALDKARDGIEQQARAGFTAQFTPDTFKSTFFGDNGLQAKLFNQPTDALLMQYSREANANVLRNKEYLTSKGHLIVDEESAAQALLQEGLAVRTASGPVFLNPEFKQSTGIENNEMLAKVFEQVKQEVSSKSGGRSKAENVRVVVTGGTATFIDYDDNNVPLRQYVQTPDDLNRRYRAWVEEQAVTAPENILDSVRVGGPSGVTLNVTRPWGNAFMSNDLGTKVAKHLARSEGWTPDWRNTRSAEGQADPNLKQVDVIGIGISKQDHPDWVERLDAAKGSPAKMSQVIGDFAGEYFKTFPAYVKEAGIPQTFEFGRRPDAVYIGLADAMWHGGTTGAKQYAAAIKTASTDLEQAKKDLMSTAVYKQSGPARRKFLERGLIAAWMPRGANVNQ